MSTTVSADNISTVSGGHTADRSIQSGFLSLDVVKNKPKALPYTPMITNPPSRRSQSKAVAVKGKENNLDNKDSLQRVLMMLQQKKYEEVVTKSNDSSNMKHEKNSKNKSGIENIQTTFLTSVAEALDKLELEDKQESRIDADHLGELKEESITNRSVFLEEEIIENPDSQLYNSISPVEFVKLKTNYNNIFTTK